MLTKPPLDSGADKQGGRDDWPRGQDTFFRSRPTGMRLLVGTIEPRNLAFTASERRPQPFDRTA